jgi:hypothetical protein
MLRRLKFISAESISKLKLMWPTPNISDRRNLCCSIHSNLRHVKAVITV